MDHLLAKRLKTSHNSSLNGDLSLNSCRTNFGGTKFELEENLLPKLEAETELKLVDVIPTQLSAEPYQPEDVPPYRDKRRPHLFQLKWYKEYPWLHFDINSQMMFCHQCLTAISKGAIDSPPNNIFAKGGFRNWKKGVERFRVHENSQLHKDTLAFSVERRRKILEKFCGIEALVSCIKYLISQGMIMQKDNLTQLLELRRGDLPFLDTILSKVSFTPEDEKEVVSIMAACILRTICFKVRSLGNFALIVDKVRTPLGDMLALNIRTVENQFNSDQLFLGLYIEQSITDLKTFLPFENLIYHSYGFIEANELQNEIQKLQPSALKVHMWNLNLSLVLQEFLKEIKGIGNIIFLIDELEKILIPTELFTIFENETSEYVMHSCPQRKAITFKTISGILNNYSKLLQILEDKIEASPCSFIPSALLEKLRDSETFFYFLISKIIFYPIENLSKIMERAKSARGVSEAVQSIIKILLSFKDQPEFDILWSKFISSSKSLCLNRSELDNDKYKETNKANYFTTIDSVLKNIKEIFEQRGFKNLLLLEEALCNWKIEKFDQNSENVLNCYDISAESLLMEKSMLLKTFDNSSPGDNIDEITEKLKGFKVETINLFPQVVKLINLLTLAPITRVHNERSFARSSLLNTFLKEYKSKDMVSDVCVCFVYKDEPGICNLAEVAQEFVASDPLRSMLLFRT